MGKLIINVGRQFGSGGRLVAHELGNMLGIKVYDNELIKKAAESSGFSAGHFRRSDEKRSLFPLSAFFSSLNFGAAKNYMGDTELFNMQSQAIVEIAEKDSAIIIGRCADYILRNRKDTIDVFITSPKEVRIKRVAERMKISPEKAAEKISEIDRKRETYYNYFTFGNWGMASNYDLCIDSSILGIKGTAEVIIAFARKQGLLED